jgi:two-component system, NarL family, response regulator YdfI
LLFIAQGFLGTNVSIYHPISPFSYLDARYGWFHGNSGRAIANGWLVIHPTAMNLVTPEKTVINPVQILTAREIEVLIQIGAGLVNKAIAQNLHISEHTVKFHLSSIFQKLDVSTRTEAVTAGIRMGLILL